MPFFDLPTPEQITPQSRTALDGQARYLNREEPSRTWRVYAGIPGVVETRLAAMMAFSDQPAFPRDAKYIAVMLIAHARKCRTCFGTSWNVLLQLGFDDDALSTMCANPDALPLADRDRHFVKYALRIATDSATLTAKDLREMEEAGFSKAEILQIIAFGAYWAMNTIFSQSALAGLDE